MTFKGNELASLVKLGLAMAHADGHVDKIEQFLNIPRKLRLLTVWPQLFPAISTTLGYPFKTCSKTWTS